MKNIKQIVFYLISLLLLVSNSCNRNGDSVPEVLPKNAQNMLDSIKKIDEYPAYTMSYTVNYQLDKLLSQGVADERDIRKHVESIYGLKLPYSERISPFGKSCTGFSATSEVGDFYQGHNEDWEKGDYLILFTAPENDYPSISIVDVGFAQYISKKDKRGFLLAPFYPLAGMNNQGVSVATYSVPIGNPPYDKNKEKLFWTVLIRAILDKSANLEQALQLISEYNIVIERGNELQLLIGDAQGNSAIVEWIDGETITVIKTGRWQAVTNFIQWQAASSDFEDCERYQKAKSILNSANGNITNEIGFNILEETAQGQYTQFSVLFNQTQKTLKVAFGTNFMKIYIFECK